MVTDFKQVQQGSRGIFVGFPANQAGWLIYVADKIQNSHLVVSMDVAFNQNFMSGSVGTHKPFAQSQPERRIARQGGNRGEITEETGDITNLTNATISHWGKGVTYDVDHTNVTNLSRSNDRSRDSDDESSTTSNDSRSVDSDDESEAIATKEFKVDMNAGSQQVDGFRRSRRLGGASTAIELNDTTIPLDLEMMTSIE